MIGKLFGRAEGAAPKRKKDKAIIHQSVPEEVLYPEGRKTSEADTSWMDDVFDERAKDKPATSKTSEAPVAAATSPAPATRPAPAARRAPPPAAVRPAQAPVTVSSAAPNVRKDGRPRFPVGWLITIEGAGVGEWAPLESGVSTLGPSDTDTVLVPQGAASVSFDAAQNAFALIPGEGASVRLNGVVITRPERLRDGDVIGFEGAAVKLVALCNGNFRWSDADKAG